MHLSSSCLGPKSLGLFRLEKQRELPQGNVSGKHRPKSFCLYESKKPPTKFQNNIAENAARLLLVSCLLDMLLQGPKTNTRTGLKCPNSRESILIRLTSHAVQILCQYLYQCLSLN